MTHFVKTEAELVELLKKLRESRELSCEEVGKRIGRCEQNIGLKENGWRSFTVSEVIELLNVYGCKLKIYEPEAYEHHIITDGKELASFMRIIRKKRELNMNTAGDLIGISGQALQQKEVSKTQFRANELFAMAKIYNIEIIIKEKEI